MTAKEVLNELESLGSACTKKMLMKNYDVREPFFGVKIGPVAADLGDNACQMPFAPDYIRKVQKRGTIGKKRKTAKC